MEVKENTRFLPLGTIVRIRGSVKKVMIIARGLMAIVEGETCFFDYGCVTYPEGLMGDRILYCNDRDVTEILQKGYTDEDDALMIGQLKEWMKNAPAEYGDPVALNRKRQGKAVQRN